MDHPELKPCPFCGGESDLFSVPSPVERGQVAHRVICRSPHCAALGYFKTEEGAIKAWNTRAERTCHVESMHGYTDAHVSTRYTVELSCHTLEEWPDSEPPAYCPWCGARVVEE